ncbi:hypothetical protein A5658_06190 [Mycobacterium sp. 1245111.1]|uniref:DUF4226 domain-containing protein n=1 Tax=Mycobacterium sp. 1245111.1 TaxID=1834073 RepID=UPI0007FF9536|nr:DUF4226 domain-containing protein [Mycobacterium sp. 1245111.1]OBK36414.1 hypothetical protein A5658_06190 [Mycobacterium sp. 1245111.1]
MTSPDQGSGSDHQEGDAAEAIRHAEAALAQQNSVTAQIDLQVVAAVLNAHQKAAAGRDVLNTLQRDIEQAVASRSDLDTPAGARDFQRYLIGKLRDIQSVVAGASLDDTSNSALMAAWTSLYHSTQPGPDPAEQRAPGGAPAAAPHGGQTPPTTTESELAPYADESPEEDLGLPPESSPPQAPPPSAPAAMPSIPSFGGGGGLPSGGGYGVPSGFPLPNSGPAEGEEVDDVRPATEDTEDRTDDEDDHQPSGHEHAEPASGPTTATLPNGETLTAASPQLAAAIEAAAGGTPIADAFRQQGMTIPPPGTAVSEPLDPSRLAPGDIGMFTDRHALALGESRALMNGQIQHISTVSGPDFLGWEHPPAPVIADAPGAPSLPAPTRPAIAERTETA